MSFCARYSFEKHCKKFNDRPRSSQNWGIGHNVGAKEAINAQGGNRASVHQYRHSDV